MPLPGSFDKNKHVKKSNLSVNKTWVLVKTYFINQANSNIENNISFNNFFFYIKFTVKKQFASEYPYFYKNPAPY